MSLPKAPLSLCLFLVLLAPAAMAQQASDADKAAARALAQQGQDALDRRDFTTAADRFERARQLFPAPTLALGLARAQIGVGRWVAAQETLNRILREGAPAGSPPAWPTSTASSLAPSPPASTAPLRSPSPRRATCS
jgi:hypothetical protein